VLLRLYLPFLVGLLERDSTSVKVDRGLNVPSKGAMAQRVSLGVYRGDSGLQAFMASFERGVGFPLVSVEAIAPDAD
jgi:hypothetical protein